MRWIACVVPFCEGGYKVDSDSTSNEAICGDHWKLVDKALKASRTRRRREAEGDDEAPVSADAIEAHYWTRMCRQAIERAAGIA